QVPQQSIAKPVARHRPQLLLDPLERPTKRRSAPQSLLNIKPANIQPHRVKAGEPAHRAREINIRPHLLAPVTLHINHHPSALPPPPPPRPPPPPAAPPPPQTRQRNPIQHHMLDAEMDPRRPPPHHRRRRRTRQRQRDPPRRSHRVARRIERAINQRQRGRAQLLTPKRKLANARCILRPQLKPLRPPPKRRPTRRQRRHLPARNRRPRRRTPRHHDP